MSPLKLAVALLALCLSCGSVKQPAPTPQLNPHSVAPVKVPMLGSRVGTVYEDIDQRPANWYSCIKPACDPGGQTVPTAFTQDFAAQGSNISLTGPGYSNGMAIFKVPETTSADHFNSLFTFRATSGVAQAYEFDMFQFVHGLRYMFGSQCVTGGKWQIWNDRDSLWLDTAFPCEIELGTSVEIAWSVHRDGANMVYDTLAINGQVHHIDTAEPAGLMPAGWDDAYGIQFQMDEPAEGGYLSEQLCYVSFLAWSFAR